jgi:hypothetical protein
VSAHSRHITDWSDRLKSLHQNPEGWFHESGISATPPVIHHP